MKSQEAQGRGLHKFALGAIPLALLLAYTQVQAAGPESAPGAQGDVQKFSFLKGRVLLQPKPGLSEKDLDKLLKVHGGRRGEHLKEINVHVIELPPQASEVAVAKALRGHPHVKFAELDEQVESTMIPNDPSYSKAWHLPKIGAPAAWDQSSGNGVTIAVIDSGVDGSHPELVGKMVPGWNMYDNNSDTTDVRGHGTMVAGIAAAATNNSIGVSGLSYNSKIMPIRICDLAGYAYFSTIAKAINWAADKGAKVASISWTGAGSSTIHTAAQYMRGKGGVVVMAAGNSGILESLLATDAVTVVSATDGADAKTSWSSYGNYVDVAAPGIGIQTIARGGAYATAWGTSMATPIVSATYALMASANPGLSPAALDSALFTTALDLGATGFDNLFGRGRVRADLAVAKAKVTVATDTLAPATSITSPSAGGTVGGLVPVSATATDNLAVTKVELWAGSTLVATDTTAPYAFVWSTANTPDGTTSLQTRAYDSANNVGKSASVSVTVRNDLVAPTAAISNPAPGSKVSGTVNITVQGSDNNKVAKIVLFIDGKEVAVNYGSTMSYAWSIPTSTGKKNTGGTSSITARVYDPANNMGSASVSVYK